MHSHSMNTGHLKTGWDYLAWLLLQMFLGNPLIFKTSDHNHWDRIDNQEMVKLKKEGGGEQGIHIEKRS